MPGSTTRPNTMSAAAATATPTKLFSTHDDVTTFQKRGTVCPGTSARCSKNTSGEARTSANTVSRITNDRRVAGGVRNRSARVARRAPSPGRAGAAPSAAALAAAPSEEDIGFGGGAPDRASRSHGTFRPQRSEYSSAAPLEKKQFDATTKRRVT